jgi:ABC-type uncharacterized transport system permease subunit
MEEVVALEQAVAALIAGFTGGVVVGAFAGFLRMWRRT